MIPPGQDVEPTNSGSPELGVMFRREQDPATLVEYARRVEAIGFDQLWVVEDCFYSGGISQAAIALAATSKIKVGLGIAPGVARNPAFLAMEFASLANAFPGRFIGGIGHGVAEWMDQAGIRPKSWLRSLEEMTSSVRRILRGENVSVAGEYVTLDHVLLDRVPRVVPDVLLGVRGEKSLRLAGACSDGLVLAENSSPAYVRWARERFAEGRADAGRDGDGQVVMYVNTLVDDAAPDVALAGMREILAMMNAGGVQVSVWPASFAREMQVMLDEGGADALRARMPDEWVQELAITGSGDDARRSLARYAAAGVGAVVLTPPDDVDFDAWLGKQVWAV